MGRRRSASGREESVEPNLTPMLDVVFIMLIFFIVTATFLDETGVDLTQPPPPPDTQDPTPPRPAIIVYVNGQNLCAVDGLASECSNASLAVEKALAEKANAAVILRVDAEAKNSVLISVKDDLDSRGVDSKLEILRGGAPS